LFTPVARTTAKIRLLGLQAFLTKVGAKDYLDNSLEGYFTLSPFAENLGHLPYLLQGLGIYLI